ncbi:membrane protein insertion efficiency factor YidD [Maricaulaceae bacterium MS644]
MLARLPARFGLALLTGYKYAISPVFYALGVRCRHAPTCSVYAADCVRDQGLWRGSWLALGRILRCRPGGTHGYDPARPRTDAPSWKIWAFRERPARPVEQQEADA